MQKTDSIWGSVRFHAGADCIIMFSIYKMPGAAWSAAAIASHHMERVK